MSNPTVINYGRGVAAAADGICPGCGSPLATIPKSRGTCASCRRLLIVRRERGEAILLTVEADDERTRHKAYLQQRKRAKSRVGRMRVGDDAFDEVERVLSERLSHRPDPTSVFWELAAWSAAAAIFREDWQTAANCLEQMALQLAEEGEPWVRLSASAHTAMMKWYAEWEAPDTVLSTCGCQCTPCSEASEVLFTMDEASREQHLPHTECETPPCRCGIRTRIPGAKWRGVFEDPRDDLSGREDHFVATITAAEWPDDETDAETDGDGDGDRLIIFADPERLLPLDEVAMLVDMNEGDLWSMAVDGRFPAPDEPSGCEIQHQDRARWRLETVRIWRQRRRFHPSTPARYAGIHAASPDKAIFSH